MQFRVFEAGKPEGKRAVDKTFDLAKGKIALGGGGCEVEIPGAGGGAVAEIHVSGATATLKRVGDGAVSVGGREIPAGGDRELGGETLLSVAGKDLVFKSSAPGGEPDSERPSIMAKDVLQQVFKAIGVPEGENCALVVYDQNEKLVKKLDLGPSDEEITIGRANENRLVLYSGTVSSKHARVVRDGVGYLIYDLESRNGVEVNGTRVKGKQRIQSGDRLKIGDYTIRFVDPRAKIDLSASVPDLKKLPSGKPGEQVVVGDKDKGAVHETHSALTPSGQQATVPEAGKSGTGTDKKAELSSDGAPQAGSGALVFVLIGVGALVLIGMIVLVVLAMRSEG